MINLYANFCQFCKRHTLFDDAKTVIAAVSGGVDSMVMLDLLRRQAPHAGYQLVVAHFNHVTRSGESDEDEKFVTTYSNSKQLEFRSRRVAVEHYARDKALSFEMAARTLRYDFLEALARDFSQAVIATGHTLDDQAETLLLHICKGTGLQGLVGIPVRRGNIIRPILFSRKNTLYEYARQNGVPYREDHTNYESEYDRNFIRNDLIPAIEAHLNPNLAIALDNLSRIAAETQQLLLSHTKKALQHCRIRQSSEEIVLEISRLKTYFTSVKMEVIRLCVQQLQPGSSPRFSEVNQLITGLSDPVTGKQYELGDTITAVIDRDRLIISRPIIPWEAITIEINRTYETPYFTFRTELYNIKDIEISPHDPDSELIDYDQIGRQLKLRPWRRGDRIVPLGQRQSKKISDIFIDQKISLLEKRRIPILESDGEIIWVAGLKLSDRFKLTERTIRTLKLIYARKSS